MSRLSILHLCLALFAGASPAIGATRTFVASTGADTGVCSRAAPCRSFAYAVTQTSPAGELDVLDSAGYGPVTITQAISIVAPAGVVASIAVPANVDGITTNAGTNDLVEIRGLTLEGGGTGGAGVVFNSGDTLLVSDCVIQNFVGRNNSYAAGILIQPNASSARVIVEDTKLIGNKSYGLMVQPAGTVTLKVAVQRVLAAKNDSTGVYVAGTYNSSVTVAMTQVTATGNGVGLSAAGQGTMSIFDGVNVLHNHTGLSTGFGTHFIGRSVVLGNDYGLSLGAGTSYSYGNNQINANTTDISGTLNPAPLR